MKRRPAFDGTNQSRALRGLLSWSQRSLRTRSGKTLKDLAEELAMAPATLARYLNGTTPLSSEQFAAFAAAFETTEPALIAACFPSLTAVEPDAPWSMRAALRGHIPEDDIDGFVERYAGRPIEDQQAAAARIIASFQERVRKVSEEMLRQLRDRPA